uniref:NAD(P)-binding protein n=1 Tax=Globodera rostochiensis TaxID=31243 RepID=A0A914HHU9_GLORO
MASSGFAIVTGANTGLGLHLVKSLYASGTYASIVLACRSEERAKSAIRQIYDHRPARYFGIGSSPASSENCGISRTKLEFIKLDLTNNESVRSFVEQLAYQHQKRDLRLLVNNAGVMGHPFLFVHGVEAHFATNHLGHFLLTKLLIDQNWLAPDARILLITSGLYDKIRSLLSIDELTSKMGGIAHQRSSEFYYAFSKLANCLHAVALAKRLRDGADDALRNVKVVVVRPGFVRGTELGRHTNLALRLLAYPLIWMLAKNLDQGISSMLHCAQCDAAQLQTGALYYEGRVVPYSETVTDEAANNLWEMSNQMIGQTLEDQQK